MQLQNNMASTDILNKYINEAGNRDLKSLADLINKEYEENGYIKTNFSWVKPEWIKYGQDIGALSYFYKKEGDGSLTYNLRVIVETETEEVKKGGKTIKKEREKINHKAVAKWFYYLDYVRGHLTKEQFNERSASLDLM